MQINVIRKIYTDVSTIGDLQIVDSDFHCFTLEDTARRVKINKKTAIPAGTYEVVVTWSKRFKRLLPLLLDVPFFTGVRIHPGNDYEDTDGCILVGEIKLVDQIGNSQKAFNSLFTLIQSACSREKVWVSVCGGYGVEDFKQHDSCLSSANKPEEIRRPYDARS